MFLVVGMVGTLLCMLWLAATVAVGFYVGDWVRGSLLIAFTLCMVVRVAIPASWLFADLGSVRQAEKRIKLARERGDLRRLQAAKAQLLNLRWQRRQ